MSIAVFGQPQRCIVPFYSRGNFPIQGPYLLADTRDPRRINNRMKTLTASLTAALALTLLAASAAAQGAPWLHVEVRDSGDKSETVNVNVPMSMARIALKAMPEKVSGKLNEKIAQNGKISLTD